MGFKDYIKEDKKTIKPKVIMVNFENLLTDVMNQMDRWDMEYYEDISNAYEALVPEFRKAAKKVFEKNAKKFDYKLVIKGR
jgi:hypothetical protein